MRTILAILALCLALPCFGQFGSGQGSFGTIGNSTGPGSTNQGTFIGNGSGLTNILEFHDGMLDTDTNVTFFVKSVYNITDPVARESIAQFIADLKRGGIWPPADCLVLDTNYGATTTTVKTLLGRTAYITSITGYSEFGAINPVISVSNMPFDFRTNTMITVMRSVGDGGFAGGGGVDDLASLSGFFGGTTEGVRITADREDAVVWRKGGTDTSPFTTLFYYLPPGAGVGNATFEDHKRRTISAVIQGTNFTPYVDGVSVNAGAFVIAPANLGAAAYTNWWIGSDAGGSHPFITGEIKACLIYTNALNQVQVRWAERALRNLELSTENWYVFGDSRAIMQSYGTGDIETYFWTNGWPAQLQNMGQLQRNVCWWNDGISGSQTAQFINSGAYYPFLTNHIFMLKPGGKVTRSHAIVQLQANDLIFAGGDIRANMQNILTLLQTNNFETWVMTEPPVGTNYASKWSAATDLYRITNNAWLRANSQLYDHLIDRELKFPTNSLDNTNGLTALTPDGLHLRYRGNMQQAKQIYSIYNKTPDVLGIPGTNGNLLASIDSAGLFTGNGNGFTNLQSGTITQTNFVLNTVYSNALGRVVIANGTARLSTAGVTGYAALDVMVDQIGGSTFVLAGGAKVFTTIAVSLVGTNDIPFTVFMSANARYYFTNSSSGAGDFAAIVSGTGQVTPLSKP